MGHSPRLSKK
jgi:hypothetical protein